MDPSAEMMTTICRAVQDSPGRKTEVQCWCVVAKAVYQGVPGGGSKLKKEAQRVATEYVNTFKIKKRAVIMLQKKGVEFLQKLKLKLFRAAIFEI